MLCKPLPSSTFALQRAQTLAGCVLPADHPGSAKAEFHFYRRACFKLAFLYGFDPGILRRDGALVVPSGSRRVEDLLCGEISCGSCTLTIPVGKKVVRLDRFASETIPNPIWYLDPYMTIGWCNFADVQWQTLPSGVTEIVVTLKNWGENRARLPLAGAWLEI